MQKEGNFYVQNGILKGKGLDLVTEPPPLRGLEIITPYTETCKSSTSLPWNAMLITFFWLSKKQQKLILL